MKLLSRALHSAALKWTMGSLGLALAGLSLGTTGCTTDAYCFSCNDNTGGSGTTTTTGTNTGGAGGAGGFNPTGGTGGDCFPNCTTSSSGSGCMQTNGGVEICDGLDNDCNGTLDDGFDFSNPKTCGTCDHNCYAILINNDPLTIGCTPSGNPGKDPGTCTGTCTQDYFDLDSDGTCEYYCIKDANDDTLCDNKDNDCDGVKDEDVNLCTDTANCGQCGRNCTAPHATTACVNSGGSNCTTANTQCQIQQCVCNGPGDCWWDLDKSYATGCEYQCDETNGGVEICGDSLDNDCDGKIDEADDLSGDPNIGVICYGDPDGECATMAHAGTTQCIGNKVVCAGMNVLVENQKLETCDGVDNDCDGAVDDNPTDAGGSCGMSNIFPCTLGTLQCQSGQIVCNGAVDPGTETCDGNDNDCNGTIDDNLMDVGMACDVPPPPPMGATSPCMAGVTQCVAGGVQCVGSVKPITPNDTCGVDANCDGTLTNQPDLQTDINNCGACGNSCLGGAVHANWACETGACVFKGCQTGYVDLDNDQKCEYACTYISSQESCNGVDDNCNGQIDEGVIAPSPVQVCGVSPSASSTECTTGVTVACQNGSWACSFPAGVCNAPGGCSATPEICDTLDNNCNGFLNETTPNYGKPCASDDGKPPPGDGACRTTGTYVCNGASSTICSATKADCATLPGGCTEVCDGVDNDCDGLIDEPYTNKGTNGANFVRPAVTKVASNLWIMSHEASRPSATTTSAGSGNGYWTSAPAGKTLDKTSACSVPTKIPWFNVTPLEAEQTCTAIGGKLCSTAEWQSTCTATASCKWGYSPRPGGCTSSYTSTKYCNLGLSFDFDMNSANGNQNGLLVTGAAATNVLQNCWSDWSGLQGNTTANNRVYDTTGNLREITKGTTANTYPLMGGSFNSSSEDGATCGFTFYTVDQSFQLFDLGFRCCFSADPTL